MKRLSFTLILFLFLSLANFSFAQTPIPTTGENIESFTSEIEVKSSGGGFSGGGGGGGGGGSW